MRQAQLVRELAVDCARLAAAGEPYEAMLVSGLYRVIGSDNHVLVNRIDASRAVGDRIVATVSDGKRTFTRTVGYAEDARMDEIGRRHHPIVGAMERGDRFATLRLSDLVHLPTYWAGIWHQETGGKAANVRYSIGLQLQMRGPLRMCAFVNRGSRDFTTREVDLVEELRAPLAAAQAFRTELDLTIARVHGTSSHGPAIATPDQLTGRQQDVLALVALGWTNTKIGHRLGITERTVRKHVADICDRLDVSNRAAAVAVWTRIARSQPLTVARCVRYAVGTPFDSAPISLDTPDQGRGGQVHGRI